MHTLFFMSNNNIMMHYSKERSLWPTEALNLLERVSSGDDQLKRGILLTRVGCLQEAEAVLLASARMDAPTSSLALELFCGLLIRRGELEAARAIRKPSPSDIQEEPNNLGWRLRECQLLLAEGRNREALEASIRTKEQCYLFLLVRAQAYLGLDKADEALKCIEQSERMSTSPEAYEIKARILLRKDLPDVVIPILTQLLEAGNVSNATWEMILHVNRKYKEHYKFWLARVLSQKRVASRTHSRAAAMALLERLPATSRRYTLKERIEYSIEQSIEAPAAERSDGNLLTAYEHLGQGSLLSYISCDISKRLSSGLYGKAIMGNRALQLASIIDPGYQKHVERLGSIFSKEQTIKTDYAEKARLRVGFVTPDLDYHPVGRFLGMLLANGLGRKSEIHIVFKSREKKRALDFFRENDGITHQLHDYSGGTIDSREAVMSAVRELDLDVAVDLAGWTGDHSADIFGSRIGRVQVNYLGYFASTGLRELDLWLGDRILFPNPMREWHSEGIWRLERCFIAWQPYEGLPEWELGVPEPLPRTSPIIFGSFNHSRKLSDATLAVWGRILNTVPESRLALKAFTSDDPGMMRLIRRRMHAHGLDPERVVWLPTCPNPIDHLRQYGLVDVALDPFPNGGCTTSCEALWMGVPVITLRGQHYVSRMSSAVLEGGSQQQWIADSIPQYIELAKSAAENLRTLRSGRESLRAQLEESELGDAKGLAESLERNFKQMIQERIAGPQRRVGSDGIY